MILKALEHTRWNRKRAAQELQISYKSLLYKLKQIGVQDSEAELATQAERDAIRKHYLWMFLALLLSAIAGARAQSRNDAQTTQPQPAVPAMASDAAEEKLRRPIRIT